MTFDQTHPVFALSDRLVDELCEIFPDDATYLGVDGFDDRWPDLSPDGAGQALAALREMRGRIEALPPASNRWDALAIGVAAHDLDRTIARHERSHHLRNLNSIASPVQSLRETFDHMKKDTVAQWEAVATRLESLGTVLSGYQESLEQGRRLGLTVAVRQVDEAITQASVTASDDSSFVALLSEFEETVVTAPDLTAPDQPVPDVASGRRGSERHDELRRRLEAAIESGRGAYRSLVGYLTDTYRDSAPAKDAVGRNRYLVEATDILGTTPDLDETYRWGWQEVASLRHRMAQVAEEIAPGGGISGALEVLKTDPARSAATPEELVAFLDARIGGALERLDGSHFDVPGEIRRCEVKLAPVGGPLGAYYVGPSEDFTRPGSVWWSIERDTPRPLYDDVSTAYHEGFPGHHLQVGTQISLQDRLSRLHRMWVWMSGTGEGWALYAERLMDELGYLDQPDYVFGYLTSQMLRACRVVIDIGSHLELPIPDDQPFHPGETWSFELAVEMLERYATLDTPYAEAEVNRYLGWPGQAISYKIGERHILQLRDELRARHGDAFDLRRFHRRVLEVGPVGLDVMKEYVLAG